jgi:hypothetical protein
MATATDRPTSSVTARPSRLANGVLVVNRERAELADDARLVVGQREPTGPSKHGLQVFGRTVAVTPDRYDGRSLYE